MTGSTDTALGKVPDKTLRKTKTKTKADFAADNELLRRKLEEKAQQMSSLQRNRREKENKLHQQVSALEKTIQSLEKQRRSDSPHAALQAQLTGIYGIYHLREECDRVLHQIAQTHMSQIGVLSRGLSIAGAVQVS